MVSFHTLTHFLSVFCFCTLWKHKTSGFLRFLGSIGMLHWREWDISPSASILWESQFILWEFQSFLLRLRVTQKSLQLHFFISHMHVTTKSFAIAFLCFFPFSFSSVFLGEVFFSIWWIVVECGCDQYPRTHWNESIWQMFN